MAAFAYTSVPMWLTGCTYDADGGDDLRNSGISALTYPAGPAGGSSAGVLVGVLGTGLGVTAGSGMTVNVGGGSFIASNPSAANGGYSATLASQATLTVAASDPVNPRIDLVCGTVVDNGNSTSYGMVQVVTGTPAPSPSPPATPASSARLAQVSVPALATGIVSGDITDVRSYTCAVGGIVTQEIAYAPPGYNGCFGYDVASDRLYHNSATTVRQPHVLPFAPQTAEIVPTSLSSTALPVLVPAVTFECDGATDIKVTYTIPGLVMITPMNAQVTFNLTLDGTIISAAYVSTYAADGSNNGHAFTWVYYTSPVTTGTPAAGTHTLQLTAKTTQPSSDTGIISGGTSLAYLRLEPVVL